MSPRSFEDQPELISKRAGTKEKHHPRTQTSVTRQLKGVQSRHDLHEGVGEADFGAIYSAVPHTFNKGEVVGIIGIQNNLIDYLLQVSHSADIVVKLERRLYPDVVHLEYCVSKTGLSGIKRLKRKKLRL